MFGRLFTAAAVCAGLRGDLDCTNTFGGKRRSLRLRPALELRSVGEIESVEERTNVKGGGLRPILPRDGNSKIGDVARDLLRIEPKACGGSSHVDPEIALQTVDQ